MVAHLDEEVTPWKPPQIALRDVRSRGHDVVATLVVDE
jgi:hypothetical protein